MLSSLSITALMNAGLVLEGICFFYELIYVEGNGFVRAKPIWRVPNSDMARFMDDTLFWKLGAGTSFEEQFNFEFV